MSYGLAKARYTSDATETVSASRLLIMLYDRLVSDLLQAEEAMQQGRHQVTGDRLGSAQAILLELHATLDTSAWSAGEALDQLYLWIIAELMRARMAADPDRVAQCRLLLEPLREAWHQAASGRPAGPLPMAALRPAQPAAEAPVPARAGVLR